MRVCGSASRIRIRVFHFDAEPDIRLFTSVADPGCLSRIPDPDFYPSRIPDLGSKNSNKRDGWEKNLCHTIFCSHKFPKLQIILFLKCRKNFLGQFSKNYRTFYPKNCQEALKNMGLESGIRDPEKTYPGSRIQGSKRHRIPDPDPQHCFSLWRESGSGFPISAALLSVLRCMVQYPLPCTLFVKSNKSNARQKAIYSHFPGNCWACPFQRSVNASYSRG